MALPAAQSFITPLGAVAVDRDAWLRAREMPGVIVDDRPHADEHAIEVQLPFLQSTLNHFQILPVAVGEVDAHRVAALLESLWGGPETLIVISSDLSHYHPYRQAQWRDKATIAQIRQLDATLNGDQACGAGAINGLLLAACRHRLTPHLLDLRNSGDTAGDRERVVGYASIRSPRPRSCPPLKRSEKPCLPRPATPFAVHWGCPSRRLSITCCSPSVVPPSSP
jgi:AmmeMemoRadiSam system protein B